MNHEPRHMEGFAAPLSPSGVQDDVLSSVLVVVPALNEATHIEACLRSLISSDVASIGVPIIVADGGSTDETQGIVTELSKEYPGILLMHNPDRVQAAAINHAVKTKARPHHRILVRCDAHAAYPPNYIREVSEQLVQTDAASVVTVMDAHGTTCFGRAAAWIVDTPFGSGGSAHRGGTRSKFVDHGHHAAMDLNWFNAIGGYDPEFAVNEDAEYDYRLGQAGGRIWLESALRLKYTMRASPRALWRQYFRYGQGRAANVLKHRSRPRLRQMVPVINLLALLISLALVPLDPRFLAWPVLYVAALGVLGVWMSFRHHSACGLLSGPALAIMHVAWALGFASGAAKLVRPPQNVART